MMSVQSHIPVILLTAKNESDTSFKGFEKRNWWLFHQAILHREELLVRITNLIEQRKLLTQKISNGFVTQHTYRRKLARR